MIQFEVKISRVDVSADYGILVSLNGRTLEQCLDKEEQSSMMEMGGTGQTMA